IVVAGFTGSGEVFAHGVEVFWDELPKSLSVVLKPLRSVNVNRGQATVDELSPAEVEPEPLDGC
ncbi:MAG: hypothetical protein QXS26_00800, partial [Thermosphaera sp.]